MIDIIASTEARVVDPSGKEGIYTISLSKPSQQETGEYGCMLKLPDQNDPITIYGEDSLQALSLAMRFASDRIEDMISRGWKYYYGDSNEPFPIGAYFVPAAWGRDAKCDAK